MYIPGASGPRRGPRGPGSHWRRTPAPTTLEEDLTVGYDGADGVGGLVGVDLGRLVGHRLLSSSDPALARHRCTVEAAPYSVNRGAARSTPSILPVDRSRTCHQAPETVDRASFLPPRHVPPRGWGARKRSRPLSGLRGLRDRPSGTETGRTGPDHSRPGRRVAVAHPPPLRIAAVESLDDVIDAMIADRVIHRHRRKWLIAIALVVVLALVILASPAAGRRRRAARFRPVTAPGHRRGRPVGVQLHQGRDQGPDAEGRVHRGQGRARGSTST